MKINVAEKNMDVKRIELFYHFQLIIYYSVPAGVGFTTIAMLLALANCNCYLYLSISNHFLNLDKYLFNAIICRLKKEV
ncbi:hypothetical protein KAU43_08795 [candidate division WOR-3 bacterium]|nr:hypothetical protein [candidate division WOR-3 bacterium]